MKYLKETFQPLLEITSIPPLPDMDFCLNSTGNFAFFDTEGLDYQTELGEHYDIVTVLPHTLIAENVFLVLRDRLNPNEGLVLKILIQTQLIHMQMPKSQYFVYQMNQKKVKELVDSLGQAAQQTDGFFTFRTQKLFGNLIIVVNKCQDVSQASFFYQTNNFNQLLNFEHRVLIFA